MSVFSFSQRKNKELVLIIDIGSASVGAAFALLSRAGKPTILAIAREDIVFQEDLDVARFRSGMKDALALSLRSLAKGFADVRQKTGVRAIGRAHVTFASPWHASETRTVSSTQNKPFRMTRDVLDRIVRREIDVFTRSDAASRFGNDLSVIEKHVMRVALNGYETAEPFGKDAESLDVGIFLSVVSHAVLRDITETIARVFAVEDTLFHSFPFVAYDIVRSFPGTQDKFLMLDIGGEVTDVSAVNHRTLMETVTFPVGKRTLVRALAKELNTTTDEALSLLRLSEERRLSSSVAERLGGQLSVSGDMWVSAFEKALADIATRTGIASTLFVSADDDFLPYATSLVKREAFAQFTVTDQPFSIVALSSAALHDACAYDGARERDPFLMMETAFANKLFALS